MSSRSLTLFDAAALNLTHVRSFRGPRLAEWASNDSYPRADLVDPAIADCNQLTLRRTIAGDLWAVTSGKVFNCATLHAALSDPDASDVLEITLESLDEEDWAAIHAGSRILACSGAMAHWISAPATRSRVTKESQMSNETVLVDQYLRARQEARDIPLPEDVAFETLAIEGVLREYELSDEEIELGRVGGGMDGGIDGFYTFLDGALLDEDSEVLADEFKPAQVRRNVDLDVWIVQAKRETSFTETTFDKWDSSLRRLFDLTMSDVDLEALYSKELIARVRIFTEAWRRLGIRSPRIAIHIDYVTRGEPDAAGEPVQTKRSDLESRVAAMVHGARVESRLIGAHILWTTLSTEPEYDLQLKVAHYVPLGEAYSGLVRLDDYYRFLSDDRDQLRTNLFDWNVRDYQGEVTVNKAIRATLQSEAGEDFWWFNNGVTILCSDASIGADSTFTLTGVQIVNGMQTSQEISRRCVNRIHLIGARAGRSLFEL